MRPLPEDKYTRSIVQISRDWIKKEGHSVLNEYKTMLSIPNIATDLNNIKRNGELLVKMFGERGFDMQLLEIEGAPPIVFGEHKVPDATRTLCFYAHYDGQPVDRERWVHEPFEPVLYDGVMGQGGRPIMYPEAGDPIDEEWRIYARAASDDKAPIIALAAAVDALKHSDIGYTSNIKLFFDGEEEMSSPQCGAVFRQVRCIIRRHHGLAAVRRRGLPNRRPYFYFRLPRGDGHAADDLRCHTPAPQRALWELGTCARTDAGTPLSIDESG